MEPVLFFPGYTFHVWYNALSPVVISLWYSINKHTLGLIMLGYMKWMVHFVKPNITRPRQFGSQDFKMFWLYEHDISSRITVRDLMLVMWVTHVMFFYNISYGKESLSLYWLFTFPSEHHASNPQDTASKLRHTGLAETLVQHHLVTDFFFLMLHLLQVNVGAQSWMLRESNCNSSPPRDLQQKWWQSH